MKKCLDEAMLIVDWEIFFLERKKSEEWLIGFFFWKVRISLLFLDCCKKV
jgi:hypothetical protein